MELQFINQTIETRGSTLILRLRHCGPKPGSVFSPGPCSGALASPAASRHRFLGGFVGGFLGKPISSNEPENIRHIQ